MSRAASSAARVAESEHPRPVIRALSEQPGADNRRISPRYGVELDVSLASDHNFYAGFTENISEGGIFVATHTLKAVGSVVEFCIFVPDSEHAIRGKGEVRWLREYSESSHSPPGMGIRFTELAEGSVEAIQAFLQHREPLFFDDE